MKNRILEFQHLLIITHNYITTDKSSVLWVCHPVCFYKHLWKKGSYLPALLQSWSIGTTAISVRQCTFTVHSHLVLRCLVHKGRWRSADSVTEEFQNSSYINISTEAAHQELHGTCFLQIFCVGGPVLIFYCPYIAFHIMLRPLKKIITESILSYMRYSCHCICGKTSVLLFFSYMKLCCCFW